MTFMVRIIMIIKWSTTKNFTRLYLFLAFHRHIDYYFCQLFRNLWIYTTENVTQKVERQKLVKIYESKTPFRDLWVSMPLLYSLYSIPLPFIPGNFLNLCLFKQINIITYFERFIQSKHSHILISIFCP